jgi:hypothetical protein
MTLQTEVKQAEKSELSKNDEAIANLFYALDCIDAGRLLGAKNSIRSALSAMKKDDEIAVYDRVHSLVKGD